MTEPESPVILACPACEEPVADDDKFCEACGAELQAGAAAAASAAAPCASCGASAEVIDTDGYCGQCGFKQPDPRDHLESDLGRVAGVTDKGITHWRNEDAMAFSTVGDDGFVIVVCDGVSTSQNPQVASQLAVDQSAALLVSAAASTPGAMPDAMVRAVEVAQKAACSVAYDEKNELGPASCTFVATALTGTTLTVAWVGDSRAYWIDHRGAQQISRDDSWATEQISQGMVPEQAYADNRAHAITRWLGADAGDTTPRVVEVPVENDGLVLVCSDGLWNYAPEADDMAKVVDLTRDESPIARAQRLCEFAKSSGGHDNIAVVVAAVRRPPIKEEAGS